jgi:hypothetical protein
LKGGKRGKHGFSRYGAVWRLEPGGTLGETRERGMQMATSDLWTFRDQTVAGTDLTGFTVEATDGDIGKVDEATNEVGASFIVVDTGPWIFGKKVMLPAGVIDRIDHPDQRIFVDRTKDEIKNAPEFDESKFADKQYRTELGGYYTGTMGRGFDEPL